MGRRILVTGGSRGIGRAVAEDLRCRWSDCEVLTPPRSELDLLDEVSIRSFLAELEPVDGLVNAAGINILGKLNELDDATIEQMITTNLIAPLKPIQAVEEGMKRRGGGRIVTFSSIWGVRSREYRTLYSMTKFGVCGMTRALARELGPAGILINCIAPGFVLTEMTRKNVPEEEREKLCAEIPLRRMAEPEEIARSVAFLLSLENTYITGQTIVIDGGFTA